MSILVGRETRLVVQGITGREGEFHSRQMQAYGTRIVAGQRPGKGGQRALDGPGPIFHTVAPAGGAGIGAIFCITEGIPALDMLKVVPVVEAAGAKLIGPNCPGATSPGRAKVGIIPASIHREGRVGLVSRSGTLTYEVVQAMSDAGIGQSTCVGIGGDPIHGLTFSDVLALFRDDPETDAIVLIGEIGGSEEEQAAAFAAEQLQGMPMVAFIAGRTAPEGKRMGHAGAIVSGGMGTAAGKVAALEAAGVRIAASPTEIPRLLLSAGVRPQ